MEQITILIVDDHKLIRSSWAFIMNSDPHFHVVAETASVEEGMEAAKKFLPDIVLMDINMPGINGIEGVPLILNQSPGSKIIGVSFHAQPEIGRAHV